MSSDALGLDIDLDAVVDREFVGDVGVPASTELLAYTHAVQTGQSDVDERRRALEAAVGADGAFEAAATIAAFNGLVRVADGTGIPLDSGLDTFSETDRKRLGLDTFAGSANTVADAGRTTPVETIGDLFG